MKVFHSLTICRVPESSIPVLVESLRCGGFLYDLLRQQPGFITADLLQSCSNPNLIQVHFFWTSFDAYLRTRQAPERTVFSHFLKGLAVQTFRLGAFVPPGPRESDTDCLTDRVTRFLEREFQVKPANEDMDRSADD